MSPPIGVNVSERPITLAPVIDLFPGRGQPNLLSLVAALQTTLELEPLLRLFSGEIRGRIDHLGLRYRDETRGIEVRIGRSSRHRCGYQLNLFGVSLGEVAFSRAERFDDSETKELEQLLCHLVYPLRNALMYRDALVSAQRDPLTGSANRAAFDAALVREVQLAQRQEFPLTLAVIDIDLFKGINDRHGHAAGDRVLKQVADAVAQQIRQSDLMFRYGGEEFVLLLAHTDRAGATLVAERVRAAVAACRPLDETSVTVSIGLAELRGKETGSKLFERADAALYRAKRNGRDQVVAD